jgi:hypothetical protein
MLIQVQSILKRQVTKFQDLEGENFPPIRPVCNTAEEPLYITLLSYITLRGHCELIPSTTNIQRFHLPYKSRGGSSRFYNRTFAMAALRLPLAVIFRNDAELLISKRYDAWWLTCSSSLAFRLRKALFGH